MELWYLKGGPSLLRYHNKAQLSFHTHFEPCKNGFHKSFKLLAKQGFQGALKVCQFESEGKRLWLNFYVCEFLTASFRLRDFFSKDARPL